MRTKFRLSFDDFRASDWLQADLLPEESEVVDGHWRFFEQLVASPGSFCGSAFRDGKPFYFGGHWEVAPGVRRVFIVLAADALSYPKDLLRSVKSWVSHVEGQPGTHRIETYSMPISRIDRWMRRLGFVYEGRLRRYTEAGQDYNVWSRVKIDGIWRGEE